MSKTCDACGEQLGAIDMGNAILCCTCAEKVRVEVEKIRAQGRQVNALGIARRLFRENHGARNYTLRDVPADVYEQAQELAHQQKITLREWIIEAMREKLAK